MLNWTVQERTRPTGRPREAHGGAASQRVPASGSADATRVSSPSLPHDRRIPKPCLGGPFHAYRQRPLQRRTANGRDELRRAHRGTPRPPDPRPARPVRRGGHHLPAFPEPGLVGHDPDAVARQGGADLVLQRAGGGTREAALESRCSRRPSRRSFPPRARQGDQTDRPRDRVERTRSNWRAWPSGSPCGTTSRASS